MLELGKLGGLAMKHGDGTQVLSVSKLDRHGQLMGIPKWSRIVTYPEETQFDNFESSFDSVLALPGFLHQPLLPFSISPVEEPQLPTAQRRNNED